MKTKLLITLLALALPVSSLAFYILGSVHAERRTSKVWKAHIIAYDLETARRIRIGAPEQALPRLEHYALFCDKSLNIDNTAFLPNRYEAGFVFQPEPMMEGPLADQLTKTRNKVVQYTQTYPDSLSSLEQWPR